MKYKTAITVATTAQENEKYSIFIDQTVLIGEALFLGRDNDDEFVFDINLALLNPENFDYKADVDIDSNELVSLRAVSKKQ